MKFGNRLRPNKGKWLLFAILLIESLSVYIPKAFAVTPVTVITGTNSMATQIPPQTILQYCNNYYYLFYWTGTTENWVSSNTGATWGSTTSTSITPSGAEYFGATCDSSGNIYVTAGTSATQFQYRQGTTSAGSITWSFAAITLTCTNGGTQCASNPSISAFDTSHVYIAFNANNAGTLETEIWKCTTTCSMTGNWVDTNHANSGGIAYNLINLGTNTAFSLIFQTASPGQLTYVTSTAWGSTFLSTHTYAGAAFQCTVISTTANCAGWDSAQKLVYYVTITNSGVFTETQEDSYASAVNQYNIGISTDGTNIVIVYNDLTKTTINTITSTNGGSTFGARTAFVTGEATNPQIASFQITPTLNSGIAGVVWELLTSNNIRFAATPAISISRTFKCQIQTASNSPTETLTLSGASVSPTSVNCGTTLTTTTLTANAGSTITVTVQADNTYSRYRFNDSSTSKSFSTSLSTVTFYQCYEVDDSYGMQAQNPTAFNANYNALITGNLNCGASGLVMFIPSNANTVTSGFNWFDAGSINYVTTFTIGSPPITWFVTPPNSNPVNNIGVSTAGGQTFVLQYTSAVYSGSILITEAFHLQDLLTYTFSGGALVTPIKMFISEQFLLANSFFFSFVNSISVAEKFNFGNAFCIPPVPCNSLPQPTPSVTVYVANDSALDTLITEILYPIGIVLAVTIFAREWGKLNESSVLPISLFMVLMIAWAGQGNVFPSWVSLMIILIGAGGIAWRLGAYFINDRETPLESESDLGSY